MKKNLGVILLFFSSFFCFNKCTWDKAEPQLDLKGYPEDIGNIMLTKCAVSGCHNDVSKAAAGGLSLTSWEKLFEGTRNNAAVIPFRSDLSFLMYFINTDPAILPTLTPIMPYNSDPLPQDEVLTIRDWIDQGAPNSDGFVKFSDDPNRKKFYVTNQGCDLVAVFDTETKLTIRYVDVGSLTSIESPHMVRVAPDGNHWYVCSYAGNTFQKFSATDDSFINEADIGFGSWNTFAITSDSKKAFVINWSASGSIAVVDLENMTLLITYQGAGLLEWPHGSTLNQAGTTLYLTAQTGNFIYKIDITDINSPNFEQVVLQTGQTPSVVSLFDPHEIVFTPDESKYFVTCQKSNEVRVFQTSNDSLIKVIPVGIFPQEFALSTTTDYLFVSCTEDDITFPGDIGSVSVIDYKNLVHVKSVYTGYQPHGIAVDDIKQLVYIANRNANPDGPAPHHTTECGGRNGYVTIIDMATLDLVPGYKAELSVDPYSIAIRN